VPSAPGGETASIVLAAQAKALVEARHTIALRFPRDLDNVRAKLLKECSRPAFAEVAIYRKPVGEGIEGPSIRMLEAAAQAMGNVVVETPAIYDDVEKRIIRVSVSDMEGNVSYSKDVTVHKTVERNRVQDGDEVIRQRTNSRGRTVYVRRASDDEILNTENALVSKCLRTLLQRIVPGWLIEEATQAVYATRQKAHATDPDAAKRKLFDAFGVLGVPVDQLKRYLGHDAATLAPKELDELRNVYTALKDGETSWREVMDAKDPKAVEEKKKGATEAVKEHIAAKKPQ
jgi:hypothetical protein